ncbi:MAG: hypothetical protein IPF82_23365 [Blastocatellia bacterium]|nr:hypothetical protein [Blastocatellia bacterium]
MTPFLLRTLGFVLGVVALGTPTLSTLHAQVPAHQPVPARSEVQSPPPSESERKTSTPYSGDLSIFEGADRAEKLQIDRVMDLLEIGPGKAVADFGAGSGWFRSSPPGASEAPVRCGPSTSARSP